MTCGREGLCLYDTKYEVRHRWKHREPPQDFTELMTLLKKLHDEEAEVMNTQPMPIEPEFEAPFEEKVRWLLLNYGYCAAAQQGGGAARYGR